MVAADRPYTRYQTDSSLLEGQVEPTGTQSVGGIKATLFRGNCPIEEQQPFGFTTALLMGSVGTY